MSATLTTANDQPNSCNGNSDGSRRRVLVVCATFPSSVDPSRGVFVKERVKALSELPGWEVRVIAPVPWFPPLKQFKQWYHWSQFPREEEVEGLRVVRPRYVLLPKLGGYIHPSLMYPAVRRAADAMRREFPFDVIDSHFVYPNGVVATKLARRYGVPAVLTGRGEDMLRFPDKPLMGRSIRWALRHGAEFVAVSREIADAMQTHGAAEDRIRVIANGVDTQKFRLMDRASCRQRLGLPLDAKIVLSIGDRLELKGFQILVKAMPELLKRHPNLLLVIVGGPGRFGRDYTSEIEALIQSHGLEERVRLPGARPHDELPLWHNAADVYALLSSREGSPNVLLESLASGLPAVATPVGGAVDELSDSRRGLLLRERTVEDAVRGIGELLQRPADRHEVRSTMMDRSWRATALKVAEALENALGRHTK